MSENNISILDEEKRREEKRREEKRREEKRKFHLIMNRIFKTITYNQIIPIEIKRISIEKNLKNLYNLNDF